MFSLKIILRSLVFLITTVTTAAHAQNSDSTLTPKGHAADVRLSAGVVSLDLDGVRSLLNAQGFGSMRTHVASVGPHVTFGLGPARLGLLAHAFVPTKEQQNNSQLVTSGGFGMAELGVPLLRSPLLSVTPMVGIGAGLVRLEMTSRDRLSLDSLIRDPRQDVKVSGRTVVGQAGLAIEGMLPFSRRDRQVTFSIDAGITSPISRTHWRRAYDAVNDDRRAGAHGGYLRVGVGFTGSTVSDGLMPTLLAGLAFVSGR
jgi:hypothetical protein